MPIARNLDPARARWTEAGLVRPNGEIDRPVRSSDLLIFPTTLKDSAIVRNDDWLIVKFKRPGRTMFAEFLHLCDASDDRILRFTQRWGTLRAEFAVRWYARRWLNVPSPDQPTRTLDELIRETAAEYFGTDLGDEHHEPTAIYRALCGYVRACLTHAAKIESESDEYWSTKYPRLNEKTWPWGRHGAIQDLQLAVSDLVRIADVTLNLAWDWDTGKWRTEVHLGTAPTLGAIVVQLMLAIARSDSIYTCSGCGVPYVRSESHIRRPKPNQNNYCPECGVDQARLDAKRRYRAKIAAARRLFAAGTPVERIAEELDTETENVEKWIGEENGEAKTRKR